MKLSTRTRYGVRMMLALARNYGKGRIYLKEIAKCEEISEKYLSLIIIPLKGIGLVKSIRGAHGGYTLGKAPAEITLKDIVDILEGDCLVDCVKDPRACSRLQGCATRDIWKMLGGKISDVLRSITLERLVQMDMDKNKRNIGGNI
jgi:Rrf2 family transcriptional regulator, cysteine metabolism repressor